MDPSLFLHSRNPGPPLRIGLLLDGAGLPRCFAEVIDQIVRSDFARLELVVYNCEARQKVALPRPRRSLLSKLIGTLSDGQRRHRLLFALYERLDHRRVAPADDPLAPVDCSGRLQHIDSISVEPITRRFVHRFPAEALERIREKQLDVLIRFGFNILRGEILSAAKYGIWSYHHGDNDYYRGGPAYFWEVYEGSPISGAVLQVLTEQLDAGKVLCKGLFATCPGFSQALNRIQPFWGAVTFMIQKLRDLHQDGWDHIERTMIAPAPYLGRKKIYTAPSNWEMLRWLGPLLIRKSVRRLGQRSTIQHWRLAIRVGARSILDSGAAPDLSGFRWIESPKGSFYADPFLIESDGKPWLFFEEFDYVTQRGRISCAEINGGVLVNPEAALERPYHLSYPCVFREGNTVYMIPETGSNGTVELYRCVRFPNDWEMETVLLRTKAVDTAIWIEDGLYWLFATLKEPRGGATQLWLFHASSLTGKWMPHPANPISTDVRNSRGAGAIFRHHNRLFRPSQDCTRQYGHSFTLNEIIVLDRHQYREAPAVTVNPSWARGLQGTHSYSRAAQVEVIDGCVPLPARRVLPGR